MNGESLAETFAFTDPIRNELVALVFTARPASYWDGSAGVSHGDCDRLADVSADLDAFYCPKCRWNGRLSGEWAMNLLHEHNGCCRACAGTGEVWVPCHDHWLATDEAACPTCDGFGGHDAGWFQDCAACDGTGEHLPQNDGSEVAR